MSRRGWMEGAISWRFIYNYLWLTLFQKTLVQHLWPCHFFTWNPPLASFVLEIKPTIWPTGLMQSSSLFKPLSSRPGFAPESYAHDVPSTSGPLPTLVLLLWKPSLHSRPANQLSPAPPSGLSFKILSSGSLLSTSVGPRLCSPHLLHTPPWSNSSFIFHTYLYYEAFPAQL